MMVGPPPVAEPLDESKGKDEGPKKKMRAIWKGWFSSMFNAIQAIVFRMTYEYVVPVNNGSHQLLSDREVTILDATIVNYMLITPATPKDGQRCTVAANLAITNLTITVTAGQTMANKPTTMAAGSGWSYVYKADTATWYRLY